MKIDTDKLSPFEHLSYKGIDFFASFDEMLRVYTVYRIQDPIFVKMDSTYSHALLRAKADIDDFFKNRTNTDEMDFIIL